MGSSLPHSKIPMLPSTRQPSVESHMASGRPKVTAQIDGSANLSQNLGDTSLRQAYVQHTNPRVPPVHNGVSTNPLRQQRLAVPRNTVNDLLPFCTAGAPLSEAQVIALSDVVGNLKELALLALGAASGDQSCMGMLEGAVGRRSAVDIAEFFAAEWEFNG